MVWTTLTAAVAAASLVALWGVSIRGWVRTRALRRGNLEPSIPVRAPRTRTSNATMLPGVTGLLVVLAGVAAVFEGAGTWTLWLGIVGAPIAVAGFVARVTALETSAERLVIRYWARPPFVVGWAECRALVPPRWPLGGWRVDGPGEGRLLMPSDLLGQEHVLRTVIAGAELRFVDGAWRRSATRPSTSPSWSDGHRNGRSTTRGAAPRRSSPAWPDR